MRSSGSKYQRRAASPCVLVEQNERAEDQRDPDAVGQHHKPRVPVARHSGAADERAEEDGGEKLQWIDVEEDDEEQNRVEERGPRILQPVAAEELVVLPPDVADHRERHGEGQRPPHELDQRLRCSRHFELDDEQRQREAEDGVGESFDAIDLVEAPRHLADSIGDERPNG